MANGSKRQKAKRILKSLPNSDSGAVELDNAELVDELIAKLEDQDAQAPQEATGALQEVNGGQNATIPKSGTSAPKTSGKLVKSKQQKARVRQARRARAQAEIRSEEDVRILQEVKAEAESINRSCEEFGVEIYEVNPDGHCLFSAIADQLSSLEILPKSSMPQFAITRRAAASYMRAHDDDFIPFIPSIEGEDALDAATDTGLLTPEKFVEYCNAVATTALWGGEPEILALARKYEIKIVVVQAGPPAVVVHSPHPGVDEDPYGRAVRISYHRRMYGLGEHYNSLRPKTSTIDKLESLL